jgi:hypothetical protein
MTHRISTQAGWLVLAALLAFAPRAHADEDRPWAQGVSEEQRQAAMALFKDANKLLKDGAAKQAADEYREALKHWDHPAIHYNLVLALVNLDQPLELHEHAVAAMKYGAAPLDDERFQQAQRIDSLILKTLAKVSLSCEQAGAQVVMDGQTLFTAPGKYEGYVRAGPHTIVASKEGFLPTQISKPLPAGETSTMNIKLYTQDDLYQYKRRWAAWVPWSVVGGGVAVAGVGALLHLQAANDIKNFDQGIGQCGGCVPSTDLASKKSQGGTFQNVAIGSYIAGGAVVATGAVLLYMNRLQPYRIDTSTDVDGAPSTKSDDAAAKPEVSVAPYIAPNQGGVTALARF